MTDNVRTLANARGLTPEMSRATARLWEELWRAVDQAVDSGMSYAMLVGTLEFVKAGLIKAHMDDQDG